MPASLPVTLLLADNGDDPYQELGQSDIPRLRRAILAHLPEDASSLEGHFYFALTRPQGALDTRTSEAYTTATKALGRCGAHVTPRANTGGFA